MKKCILLGLLLLLRCSVFAQSDTASFLLDENFQTTQNANATYLAQSFPAGNQYRFIVTNRLTKKLVLSSYYAEAALQTLEGMYAVYYDQGQPRTQGQYLHNHPEGTWLKWGDEGELMDSIIYHDGHMLRIYSRNYNDSGLHSMSVHDYEVDSVKEIVFENGSIKEEHTFHHNEGTIKTFYPSGQLGSLIRFDEKGKRSKPVYYTPEGLETTQKKYDELYGLDINSAMSSLPLVKDQNTPEMKGGAQAFQRYIDENARIPVFLRAELQPGTVVQFSFMLDSKGRATNVKLLDPNLTGLESSIREWLRNMPYWDMKGRESYGPVRYSVTMRL